MAKTKIAVFASGEGTNFQALQDACATGRINGEIVLLLANKESAGALKRARKSGVTAIVSKPENFKTPEDYNRNLAEVCKKHGIELICLAGFMLKLHKPLLEAFPERIMNIHPALLPAFGGQGLYGKHVHEAVINAGARLSGCTVHFVDALYDNGPIIAQAAVPVLATDTPDVLAARVHTQEHWLYPKAVGLFCEGRLQIKNGRVLTLPAKQKETPRIRRALLSVSDKTGLLEFAKALAGMGVEIVSTSGTAKALEEVGIAVRPLESLTGFPEILAGRVKTLHPNVHGALLMKRQDPKQVAEADLFGIEPIDLLAVNLYPFAQTLAKSPSPFHPDVIEQIDIGGVALIRAAAKNFEGVVVAVSPDDYGAIIAEMKHSQGQISPETRKRLAVSAFKHTSQYDTTIAGAWNGTGTRDIPHPSPLPEGEGSSNLFPQVMDLKLSKIQDLRYGENPHQKAALYLNSGHSSPAFKQIHGKELSYNNLLDAGGTWDAVMEFKEPACVIFKHVTPCGIGTGKNVFEAFERAWACDPLSAFGGVMAFNHPVTSDIAQALSQRFVEVIIAPDFEPSALEQLKKKPNVRLLLRKDSSTSDLQLRSIGAEVLVTEPDRAVFGAEWKVASSRQPSKNEEQALRFAWTCCKHVKSNAIVLSGPDATVGIGAGQMSRVDSVHMAGVKFKEYLRAKNPAPAALVLASDAFFPFRDGIDAAATLGISAIVQPGGSIRDEEIIAAANEHKLAMIFTGMRHFRH